MLLEQSVEVVQGRLRGHGRPLAGRRAGVAGRSPQHAQRPPQIIHECRGTGIGAAAAQPVGTAPVAQGWAGESARARGRRPWKVLMARFFVPRWRAASACQGRRGLRARPPYFAMPCRTRKGGLEVEALSIVFLEAAAVRRPGRRDRTCRRRPCHPRHGRRLIAPWGWDASYRTPARPLSLPGAPPGTPPGT
ncbi:hypothetical protein ACWY4P_16035 [Streptomyces sp. LZ34]